jgi:aspartyl-tRNA(Asn)/glutamyl-tRNA(Gln) amidotransferase subunit A
MDTIANLTGQPVTSVPCGLADGGLPDGGLPVGVQIMGRRSSDALVLAAAATFERHVTTPPFPPSPFGPS